MAYDELREFFSGRGTGPVGPNAKDVAKFIVLNADVKRSSVTPRNASSPSVMSRIFDVLSRPNYAIANTVKALQSGDPMFLDDFWAGLSGKEKTTFSDVLKAEGMGSGPAAGLGLVLDIGLDPTTYIPGAAIAKGLKAIKGGTAAGKAEKGLEAVLDAKPRQDVFLPVDDAPKVFKEQPLAVEPKAPPIGSQLELDLPGVPKAPDKLQLPETTPSVGKTRPPVGQIPMRMQLPTKAAETIDNLPENLQKVVPVPKPVPSPQHVQIADELLQSFRLPSQGAELTRTAQVRLYNESISKARAKYKKPGKPRTSEQALKVYLAAEDKLRRQGFKAPDGVYLSDVIAKVGPEAAAQFSKNIEEGTPLWQAVEDLKASTAVVEAGPVQNISESVGKTFQGLEQSGQLSDTQLGRVKGLLQRIAKESTKAADVTKMSEDATLQLTKMALQSGMSRAEIAVEQSKHITMDVIQRGRANPKSNRALTVGLEKDLGTLPSWSVNANKAVEFFMGRVATWWGQKDLRPLSLNQIASSISTAAARGQALDHMFKGVNQAQRAEVFRLAQGIPGVPSSPELFGLAQQIRRMMDNLIGRAAGNSVITKSGVSMDMLNKWMKQYKVGFEFTQGKVKNYVTGEEIDLSKGVDWLDTWKHVELPGDCKSCVFKLQQAIEQATREKALYDEIGERFGSVTYGGGFRTKVEGHPYLEGYYFPEEIARQLPRVVRDWTTPGFQSQSGVLGLYDRVLSMWKAGVTIYRPGHHVRNMVGDIYLGWMDGVNSVRPYKYAAQVQRSMNGLYQDLMNVDKIVELGVLGKDFKTPIPGKTLFTNRSGVSFTAEQIGAVAHQKGLLEHARTIEDIIDLGEGSGKGALDVKPFGGRVQKVARGASELQSHNARLAHFIDKVMKSRGSDLEKIFEEAAQRSRKWHPTGLDMTTFEKKVMRRLMPFYSWMRKSTPLLIEGLVMNPGKAVIPSKAYDALQQAQGIDTPGRQDPFPVDQMFPEWLRNEGVGPIGLPGEGLLAKFSTQQPPGYSMLGVGLNPLTQMVAQITDPGRTLSTSMSPVFQIPVELMTGRKLFTGEPIYGPESRQGSFGQYLGEQLPVYGSLQNITGITPFGSETKAVSKSDGESRSEALFNWITGLGLRGTGPYRSQARYEAMAPGKLVKKTGREEFLSQLRERLNGGS